MERWKAFTTARCLSRVRIYNLSPLMEKIRRVDSCLTWCRAVAAQMRSWLESGPSGKSLKWDSNWEACEEHGPLSTACRSAAVELCMYKVISTYIHLVSLYSSAFTWISEVFLSWCQVVLKQNIKSMPLHCIVFICWSVDHWFDLSYLLPSWISSV